MKRVMKLSVLGSKTFFFYGQVSTCNFSIVCSQDQTPRCSLPFLGCSLTGGRWRGCCLLLLREGLLLFLQNPAPGAPGLLLQGQNTSFSRRRLEISQCPSVCLFTCPNRLFYWPKAASCLHACTVKHINSDSRPKSRLWETRLGRKRLMFNAQRTWKTRFSLQILNKLCYSFGNTSIPRSILLERRFGLGFKRASVLIPGGESRLRNRCAKAFSKRHLFFAYALHRFLCILVRGEVGEVGARQFSLLWEISRRDDKFLATNLA